MQIGTMIEDILRLTTRLGPMTIPGGDLRRMNDIAKGSAEKLALLEPHVTLMVNALVQAAIIDNACGRTSTPAINALDLLMIEWREPCATQLS